ncbi:MAG TPA: TadE family protein [Pseudolabrys sp.]|nr:TadE family protein [Pseudolabrys sp.]
MRFLRKLASRSCRQGTAAIEYAFVLPLLLALIFGIIDTGRVLWTKTTLARAVEAAARCGAINTTKCLTDAQIKANAVAEAWGLSIDASAFTVTRPVCGVRVQATYAFTFTIPLISSLGTISLDQTACYPAVG